MYSKVDDARALGLGERAEMCICMDKLVCIYVNCIHPHVRASILVSSLVPELKKISYVDARHNPPLYHRETDLGD